jgi:hypothetical protein
LSEIESRKINTCKFVVTDVVGDAPEVGVVGDMDDGLRVPMR